MSDLSALEAGTAPFNRSPLDLHALLEESIEKLSADPDRNVRVSLTTSGVSTTVDGDPVRLRTAFRSVIHALRRELVASDELFVRERQSEQDGHPVSRIVLADGGRIDALSDAGPADFSIFDEWRGGCGLSLAIARRVIEAHGGHIYSPVAVPRAGALIVLPLL
jgi:signal transduction histidine kinase